MAKLFKKSTMALVLIMIVCVCGCNDNNTTSKAPIVQYEEVIVDENGNAITSNKTSSDENSSETQKTEPDESNTSEKEDADDSEIEIDYDTVVEIDICNDIIRAYLDATKPEQQYSYLSQYSESILDYQNIRLEWSGDGSFKYTVHISENADFSNAYIAEAENNMVKTAICVPGKEYYWKVYGVYSDKPLGGGKIKIKDAPVRWVKMDGVVNVRDLGGWKTESGKTVKYEMIYRGAMLDKISETGLETLKALGLKTEFDVRSTESWDNHNPVEKTGLDYHFLDTPYSYEAVLGEGYYDVVCTKYKEMFKILSDESNYPIYLHCGGGTDRTGLDSFILNGLLGVSYEDLTRDYELTSFATADRWRGNGTGGTFAPDDLIHENVSNSQVDATWGLMHKTFLESDYCTDGKLSTAIQNFLLDRGVTQSQIDAYKKIMLK